MHKFTRRQVSSELNYPKMYNIYHISITGYQKPFRRDRNKRGGGTAIYCADHLPVRRRNDLEDANSECIWIECLLNNYKLLFAVYYRPPGQLAADRDIFLSSLTSSIELAQDSGADSIVVTGDFNDRCKLWGDLIYCFE